MDEFCPSHVTADAIDILVSLADTCLHLRFHLPHRLINGTAEGIHDAFVATHGIQDRYRLGHRERKIVTHRPVGACQHRKRFPRLRIEIVAEPIKGELVDCAFQSEAGRTFPAPKTNYHLAFAVIVRRGVVTLGGPGTISLGDADHASFYIITDSLIVP